MSFRTSSPDMSTHSSVHERVHCPRLLLPPPPALGQPVPPTRHAVSVQMPTWKDMCGMALGEPRVKAAQQIGYPRSFIHPDIKEVCSPHSTSTDSAQVSHNDLPSKRWQTGVCCDSPHHLCHACSSTQRQR